MVVTTMKASNVMGNLDKNGDFYLSSLKVMNSMSCKLCYFTCCAKLGV